MFVITASYTERVNFDLKVKTLNSDLSSGENNLVSNQTAFHVSNNMSQEYWRELISINNYVVNFKIYDLYIIFFLYMFHMEFLYFSCFRCHLEVQQEEHSTVRPKLHLLQSGNAYICKYKTELQIYMLPMFLFAMQ